MIHSSAASVQTITGSDPTSLETNLNSAVEAAQKLAMHDGRKGVLVTQHSFTSYTVTVSAEVPFGQTQERRT